MITKEHIAQSLASIYPVQDKWMQVYMNEWEEVHYKRKEHLTTAGQVQRYLYFVAEGIQKAYTHHNGKEHIMAFSYAPSFSGIPESFLTQTPSKYNLVCLSDSRFYRIAYERHQVLITEHRELETLVRKATEQILVGLIERQYELLAYTIEERFRAFIERSPHLLQQLSQKDIAAYLRINATNLSKLLNNTKF